MRQSSALTLAPFTFLNSAPPSSRVRTSARSSMFLDGGTLLDERALVGAGELRLGGEPADLAADGCRAGDEAGKEEAHCLIRARDVLSGDVGEGCSELGRAFPGGVR